MRKSLVISLALLGTALAATPALAQSDESISYNGLYVGGSFGGAGQSNDVGSRINFDRNGDGNFNDVVTTAGGTDAFAPGFCNGRATGTANTSCKNDKDGIEYYGRVGFDVTFGGHFVGGVVGEFGKPEISDSVSAFSTTPAYYTMTRSLRYNAGLRARIGYTPQGSTLFYATGGGAYGRVRNSFTTSNGTNSFSTNGSKNDYGFGVGGGVEQKIGQHFSVGLEYLYTDLKDKKARVDVGAGTALATNPFILGGGGTEFRRSDDNFRWHSVRAVVAFHF
ncbi:MAG: hypothetical protein JWO15_380 [Sphingomonadales bacterium]|nr:hypothetical protein [Sphingomonadales bacterium]